MNIGINDKLDALISLTAKECGNDDVEMFNNLDTSKIKLDNKFYIKLRQITSIHKHSTAIIIVKKCFVRVAVALMALMSLGFLTIMATPDLREAVFEAVVEWYEDYISIQYKPVEEDTHKSNITDESTDISLTENPGDDSEIPGVSSPPTKIEKVMKPTYIPNGLEEMVVINNKTMVAIDYYYNDEIYYTYNQTTINSHNTWFDNSDAEMTEIMINHNTATLIKLNDQQDVIIVWTDNIYVYYIEVFVTSLNIDELINIASSVQ